jgi:hypothetical protein
MLVFSAWLSHLPPDLLGLCTPMETLNDVTGALFEWIESALQYMAMADYPYPASFLGDMPAFPVNVSCSYFQEQNPAPEVLLTSLRGWMKSFPRLDLMWLFR